MPPMDTAQYPDMKDRSIRRVYIKDGKRMMTTDGGYMMMPSNMSRKMFGKMKGGKYSKKQYD